MRKGNREPKLRGEAREKLQRRRRNTEEKAGRPKSEWETSVEGNGDRKGRRGKEVEGRRRKTGETRREGEVKDIGRQGDQRVSVGRQ